MPNAPASSRYAAVLGALHGHLVGDAFGVPYEFLAPAQIPPVPEWRGRGSHDQPPGTWSDDGALMLCLAASLLERRGFDPADAGRRFVAWREHGYMAAGGLVFDIGGTTREAIANLKAGGEPLDAGPSEEGDNGNGSLMRILPLALWYHASPPDALVRVSHDASRLTHGHSRSQVCCAAYDFLAVELLRGTPKAKAIERAFEVLDDVYRRASPRLDAHLREIDIVREWKRRTGSGYVVDCFWSAWDSVESTDSFADAVRAALRLGDDTDTTACVAGGLAGVIYGLEGIPAKWRDGLRLEGEQRDLLGRFADAAPGARG
jgi:ADP-ribosylglycohydrolase